MMCFSYYGVVATLGTGDGLVFVVEPCVTDGRGVIDGLGDKVTEGLGVIEGV